MTFLEKNKNKLQLHASASDSCSFVANKCFVIQSCRLDQFSDLTKIQRMQQGSLHYPFWAGSNYASVCYSERFAL